MKLPGEIAFKDIRAIFIDLDGTLVDSLPALFQAYLNFLNAYGLQGSKQEFDQINGPSIKEGIELLKIRYDISDSIEMMMNKYKVFLGQIYTDESMIIHGAIHALKLFHKLQIPTFLVTSATAEMAHYALKAIGLGPQFHGVITGDKVAKGKPHPDIYQFAIKTAQVTPSQAIAIEDGMNGVNAALEAGVFAFRLNRNCSGIKWHKTWGEMESWKKITAVIQEWSSELSDV